MAEFSVFHQATALCAIRIHKTCSIGEIISQKIFIVNSFFVGKNKNRQMLLIRRFCQSFFNSSSCSDILSIILDRFSADERSEAVRPTR